MAEGRITRFDRERAIVYGGFWAKMSLLERGVWFVLLMHSDFDSGLVRISQRDLARLSGCANLNRMRDAFKRLEQYGIAETIDEGGGQEKKSVRRMMSPRPYWETPLFDQAEAASSMADFLTPDESDGGGVGELPDKLTGPLTGPVTEPVREFYRAGQRRLTGPVSDLNGAGQRTHTGPVSGPPLHITHKSSPPHIRTGPVSGPVLNALSKPVTTTRGQPPQEEEVRVFLISKKIWPGHAKRLCRLYSKTEAEAIWLSVVNDNKVKNRTSVFFKRLQAGIDDSPGHAAQAS